VGHALELREAIEVLTGRDPEPRLLELTTALAERLLVLTGAAPAEDAARRAVREALEGRAAFEKLVAMVRAQEGDPAPVEDPDLLPRAPILRELRAPRAAVLAALPARRVGRLLVELGGGRRVKGQEIDRAVGLVLPRAVGDRLAAWEPWAVVHARDEAGAEHARQVLESIVVWSEDPVPPRPIITARITGSSRG
jgi:thymidine phosphorylase